MFVGTREDPSALFFWAHFDFCACLELLRGEARLQVLPLYMPALLLAVNATGMLGRSKNVLLATGIFTLLFASLSLFL